MLSIITGFVASVAHVVTGPDHLAAVTPLAIDSRKKSWVVGLSWGVGHTIGMLLIGLLIILFKQFISIDAISAHSETIIGLLLIGIGSWAIIRIYLRHFHHYRPHPHFHNQPYFYAHSHSHSHDLTQGHEHVHDELSRKTKQNVLTALSIGLVHGFAGFSHLFALLPSLALPTVVDSVLYLCAFAIGTVLTMILFSFILGFVAFQSFIRDKVTFLKWFSLAGGILAIGIGVLWLIHPI
jgi:ABC-type nickel/cobalt efflux system permease component RcnA